MKTDAELIREHLDSVKPSIWDRPAYADVPAKPEEIARMIAMFYVVNGPVADALVAKHADLVAEARAAGIRPREIGDLVVARERETTPEISRYAVVNVGRRFAQVLVVRERIPGGSRPKSSTPTGVTYRTLREANADLVRLNCERSPL